VPLHSGHLSSVGSTDSFFIITSQRRSFAASFGGPTVPQLAVGALSLIGRRLDRRSGAEVGIGRPVEPPLIIVLPDNDVSRDAK
jgi:hypothetical protein